MTDEVCLDTETFSPVNVTAGIDRYMSAPTFATLLVTYTVGEQPVECWRVDEGEPMPAALDEAHQDPETIFVAHNAPFDRGALFFGLGMMTDLEQWRCTMAQAYAHALPGSLGALGAVLGLPSDQQKNKDGQRLIQMFCVPDGTGRRKCTYKTDPIDWEKFVNYAIQDAVTLREIRRLLPTHNYVGEHLELYVVDQEINERGFKVDMQLIEAAMKVCDKNRALLDDKCEKLTDGIITAATQRERIIHHIVGEEGFIMMDLKADNIKKILEDEKDTMPLRVRQLLEIRLEGAMTSIAKYRRAKETVGADGRIRNTLQFAGAGRTGRTAGRGFQPHNLPRPTLKSEFVEGEIIPAILKGNVAAVHTNVNEACANSLRSVIVAADGRELVVSDWANIEGRVLAWLAGEQWKLDGYRLYDSGAGPDSYVALYARSFGISVEEVTDAQRQMGKGMDLSMGFGGGVGAFRNVASTYGLDLDELGRTVPELVQFEILKKANKRWEHQYIRGEDLGLEPDVFIACDALKQVWRKQHPAITELWWMLERAIKSVIRNPGTIWNVARCKIWNTGKWLIIELPSERRLLYANPQVKIIYEHDEETDEPIARDSISYMNANVKQWRRERSYGGKFAENITQAVANDVLRASLLQCRREGWSTILHVHDEIINEELYGTRSLADLSELMTRELPWSKGLPLAAAGYVSNRYKKD